MSKYFEWSCCYQQTKKYFHNLIAKQKNPNGNSQLEKVHFEVMEYWLSSTIRKNMPKKL